MDDKYNKIKRILAMAGAIILALLYILALVFAITDNPSTMSMFKAAITLTIVVPIMIYGYIVVYRVLKKK